MQLSLFKENGLEVLLVDVPVEECRHSRFNTRKVRGDEQIENLAERIQHNGFEKTRSPWAVKVDGQYEVFAGGTRLEAAKRCNLDTISVMLHVGLSNEEISRRADIDNENDEYHEPVPITEVWAEYARLNDEEDWTQERIADVKNINRARVSERIKFHGLSDRIKEYVQQGLLSESHLREITGLFSAEHFSEWLTSDQIWEELAEQSIGITGSEKEARGQTMRTRANLKEKCKGLRGLAERGICAFDNSPEICYPNFRNAPMIITGPSRRKGAAGPSALAAFS